MADLVFPEPSHVREGPLGWAEPQVNFYLESTRPEAYAARQWINEVYERFPDVDDRLKGLLRSQDNVQHFSAMDELFFYDRLAQTGRIEYEEGGVGPDFRIYDDDTYIGAVEVCSLLEKREWEAEQLKHARIADGLNQRIPLTHWFLHFEVLRLEREPSIKRLTSWVKSRLSTLPINRPDQENTVIGTQFYAEEGVEIGFRFVWRQSESPPRPTDRIVGMGQATGGAVDSYSRLRSALEKKVQKRYDTRGRPLAIAVGVWDWAASVDQFEDALYGNEGVHVDSGNIRRMNNGFFGTSRERTQGKHREISCVFTRPSWLPYKPSSARILRFDNPFASWEFSAQQLRADFHLEVMRRENIRWVEWRPARPE